ncbi:MAG: class I SAM-dependent methyltransferase [Chitinophagaceae bacterium]|nr:class I SAM-dependent methyltransferase [Chitinophagaceae bacterium]
MGFSKEWDERYVANSHMSIWPWSDLVSYVMRYARPDSPAYRVLELGCGMGANIPFFKHLNVDYHAVDGSPTAVSMLNERYPDLVGNILLADFTKNIPIEGSFDLVVDRAALTHNNSEDIRRTIVMIRNLLKSGGKFIGIDWFSIDHSDYKLGEQAEDRYTKRKIVEGQFADTGRVHFSDKQHLIDLFSGFSVDNLEHKILRREIPQNNHVFASWNLSAVKVD